MLERGINRDFMLSYHRTLCYHSLKSHKIYNMSEQKPEIIDPAIAETERLEELELAIRAARFGGGNEPIQKEIKDEPLTPEEIEKEAKLRRDIEAVRNDGGYEA